MDVINLEWLNGWRDTVVNANYSVGAFTPLWGWWEAFKGGEKGGKNDARIRYMIKKEKRKLWTIAVRDLTTGGGGY